MSTYPVGATWIAKGPNNSTGVIWLESRDATGRETWRWMWHWADGGWTLAMGDRPNRRAAIQQCKAGWSSLPGKMRFGRVIPGAEARFRGERLRMEARR